MTIFSVYDELADMLAQLDADKILSLKATPDMQKRLEELIEKSKESPLPTTEKDELDHYIVLERLMRLAKIRALTKASSAA